MSKPFVGGGGTRSTREWEKRPIRGVWRKKEAHLEGWGRVARYGQWLASKERGRHSEAGKNSWPFQKTQG